jgi:hypothetical protein
MKIKYLTVVYWKQHSGTRKVGFYNARNVKLKAEFECPIISYLWQPDLATPATLPRSLYIYNRNT